MRQFSVFLFLLAALAAGGPTADIRAQDQSSRPDSLASKFSMVDFDVEVGPVSFEDADGGEENYLSSVFLPSFSRGMWTCGARLKLRLNGSGFRSEDYDSFADILSIARFVQYGAQAPREEAGQNLYGRFGELEEVRLGYGQLISEYRNTVSFDNPTIGIEGSRSFKNTLFSGMYSSITSPGIFGMRGAYWPYQTDASSRLREMVVGMTIAGDLSTEGRLVNPDAAGVPYVAEDSFQNPLVGIGPGRSGGVLLMASVDAGLPLHVEQLDELLVYSSLSKIMGFGSGLSLGLNGRTRKGDVQMAGWLEARVSGKQYLPNYFNALYELERAEGASIDLGEGTTLPAFQTKRNKLAGQDDTLLGTFIAFEASVRGRYRLRTSFDETWNKASAGWFHIDFRLRDRALPYEVRFMFDRINVGGVKDIWSGDSKDGFLRIDFAHVVWKNVLLGFRFRQSFEPVERLGRIVGHAKQTRIGPNFGIRL
ncbi:MAG: hypothetical protein ACI84D_000671 [Thalassolituus oleivorans]|jgi:hypothetical protein